MVTPQSLFKKFHCQTEPFSEIWSLHNKHFEHLSIADPEVEKVRQLWLKFYCGPEEVMWESRNELQAWVSSYVKEVNPTFGGTGLVLVSGEAMESHLPTNAYPLDNLARLQELYHSALELFEISGDDDFKKRVCSEIKALLIHDEGQELFEELIQLGCPSFIRIELGAKYFQINGFPYRITLRDVSDHSIYDCPDRQVPGKTILRSLKTPRALTLAHELLHVLHNLNECENEKLGEAAKRIFTNYEELRTIQGTPTSYVSENSIAASFGMPPRYSHLSGNCSEDHHASNLARVVAVGIEGDLDWILPSMGKKKLENQYRSVALSLKRTFTWKKIRKLQTNFRRNRPNQLYPKESAIKIRLLDRIHRHMAERGFNTRRLRIRGF